MMHRVVPSESDVAFPRALVSLHSIVFVDGESNQPTICWWSRLN